MSEHTSEQQDADGRRKCMDYMITIAAGMLSMATPPTHYLQVPARGGTDESSDCIPVYRYNGSSDY